MSFELEQIVLGTAPLGKDGDTQRTANGRTNANMAKVASAINGLNDQVAKKLDLASGGVIAGPVTMTSGGVGGDDVSLSLSAKAGKARNLRFLTNGNLRWTFGMASAAENGANAGGDVVLTRFADEGTYLGDVVTVMRASGRLTLDGAIEAKRGIAVTLANGGIELGPDSVSNTPFIDFHSSGNARDYDSRIIANGGSSTVDGRGDLRVIAARFMLANTQFQIYGLPAGTWLSIFQNGAPGTSWPSVFLNSAGSVVGGIAATDASTSFQTTSDYRLKQNYTPLVGALESICRVEFYQGEFKAEPGKVVDYCIAHELQEEMGFVVSGLKDAVNFYPILREGANPKDVMPDDVVGVGEEIIPQSVDYSKMVPRMGAAIKELSAMLKGAIERIERLEQGSQ